MVTVRIDRAKHGIGNKGGFLFNPRTGLMCCLGFCMLKAGYNKEEIEGKVLPDDLAVYGNPVSIDSPLAELLNNYSACEILAAINDNITNKMSAKCREERLIKAAAEFDVKFEFYGERNGRARKSA